jgi:hypothetical protein
MGVVEDGQGGSRIPLGESSSTDQLLVKATEQLSGRQIQNLVIGGKLEAKAIAVYTDPQTGWARG